MNNNFFNWAVLVIAIVFTACNKHDFPAQPKLTPAAGVYIVNEGGAGSNNASLGFYDFGSSAYGGDIFQQQNGIKLGDIANDAIIYGGKMYIVVNNSGVLMITSVATGKLIDSVSLKMADKSSMQPRNIISHNGNVYVSTWFDGIKVIDTTTLKVKQTIATRSGAEGMAIRNNNLYAALSGSYYTRYDSVVSVIGLPAGNLIKNVHVGFNPTGQVYVDNNDNLFVYIYGELDASYNPVNNGIVKVNMQNGQIVKKIDEGFGKVLVKDNKIYALGAWDGFTGIRQYDAHTMSLEKENFITDGTAIKRPYSIFIDDANGDVYVTDAKDYLTSGNVYVFDKTGKKKLSFATTGGIIPNIVLFKR